MPYAYPVGNLCVDAYDSVVYVGYIAKDCVCIGPKIMTTSTDWTEVKLRGQTVKVRSLGGSRFEIADIGGAISLDTEKFYSGYCNARDKLS